MEDVIQIHFVKTLKEVTNVYAKVCPMKMKEFVIQTETGLQMSVLV